MSVKHKKGKYQKAQPVKKQSIHLAPWLKRILIYILIIVLLTSIPALIQSAKDKAHYEQEIAQIIEEYEAQIEQIKQEHEAEIVALNQEHEYGGNVSEIEREAEYIAKVIYGMARNHSINDKKAVIWCILNRVDSIGYPSTIAEVCQQSKQWIGYSDDNPVIEEDYELALEILKAWHNNSHRPMDKEFVYLSWSSDEILLRNTYEITKSTKYWRFY